MKKRVAAFFAAIVMVIWIAGCSGDSPVDADLSQVMEEIKGKIDMADMMDVAKEDLMANYGIESDDVKQFAGIMDSTGIKADEIVLFEAVDNDAATAIKEKLESRYQEKLNTSKTYSPEQYAIIEDGDVRQTGVYVAMLVSKEFDTVKEVYESYIS